MIAYFPEPYPDELFYSVVARFYAHLYPSYNMTIEDLCVNKNSRVDFEFGLRLLNNETRDFLETTFGLNTILYNHTMFLEYSFFETQERQEHAEKILLSGEGDIYSTLKIPKNKEKNRYMRYCPLCFDEDKQKYGEAYWHRSHQIRGINVCDKHGCFLHDTDIEISSKISPRLWVADDIEVNDLVKYASEIEKEFAFYTNNLMKIAPSWDCLTNEWLISKLEGTKYITARGKRKFVNKLYREMNDYYDQFGLNGIDKQHQLVKMFTGYNNNFLDICKLSFFLNIPIEEVANPKMPKESQTERFNKQVEQLYIEGLGCHRIARQVGSSPSTALKANRINNRKERNYANRLGTTKQNWNAMDEEMLPFVKELCKKIYTGDGGRPKRVTEFAICKQMEWPDKRLNYLPKCKEMIRDYSKETIEEYWARECVWAYKILLKGNDNITWRQLRDITNLRRENFERCKKYLGNYTDEEIASIIKELI